jgi:hypothetical protein
MGCGTIFQPTSQFSINNMFGIPERRAEGNTVYFYVPMATPISLDVRLQMNAKLTIVPDPSIQAKVTSLQKAVLMELTKTEALFKNKPSYESLERITPQWGVIYDAENKPCWSQYTEKEFFFNVKEGAYINCIVDLELIGILITRSTISPKFAVKFVSAASADVIDFDWQITAAPAPVKEIEEVSDLGAAEADVNTLTLRSPVLIAKEKAAAKEQVKVLFRTAEDAREAALDAMASFFNKYEVSDTESQFSDWLSDDDESTNSEP